LLTAQRRFAASSISPARQSSKETKGFPSPGFGPFFVSHRLQLATTEICLAMPAIQALADGHDVFVVTDASGGVTAEAHDMAVRRMAAAGAVPITWLAVVGEWQRDWAREDTAVGVAGVVAEHGGGSGVAFAWEMQLLAGRSGPGA